MGDKKPSKLKPPQRSVSPNITSTLRLTITKQNMRMRQLEGELRRVKMEMTLLEGDVLYAKKKERDRFETEFRRRIGTALSKYTSETNIATIEWSNENYIKLMQDAMVMKALCRFITILEEVRWP